MNRNDSTLPPANIRTWLAGNLTTDVRQALDRLARAEDVRAVAVMPDVHLAAGVCIGTVLATANLIYPQAVGSDIGCGVATMALHADAKLIARQSKANRLLAGLRDASPIIRHRRRDVPSSLPPELNPKNLTAPVLVTAALREGRYELGTLGRGNHFLEFQADEDDRVWVAVHSGSRAMGQAVNDHHSKRALRGKGGLLHLDARSDTGQAYLHDLTWACTYASVNRLRLIEAAAEVVERLFGVRSESESVFDCNHNHVVSETFGGQSLWVHRKGANAADDGRRGIVSGSMGTASFQTTGRGCADALCSSSHGAGRALSRKQAAHRINVRQLREQLKNVWFDQALSRKLLEEAPAAYKDVHAVMRAQKQLVRIDRRMRPLLCFKGVRRSR